MVRVSGAVSPDRKNNPGTFISPFSPSENNKATRNFCPVHALIYDETATRATAQRRGADQRVCVVLTLWESGVPLASGLAEILMPTRYQRIALPVSLMALFATHALAAARLDKRLDVDVDSLKGNIREVASEWELTIEYEVEIENARPEEKFELLLQVAEHGRAVCDEQGRPITIVVALDRPSKVDDDELEFEDSVVVTLPRGLFKNPKRLRLIAVVVRAGEQQPLDHKDKRIKYKRRRD